MESDALPIVAVVLSLATPIIAVAGALLHMIFKQHSDAKIREAIIQNQTDAETAKVILATTRGENEKKRSPYQNLTMGLTLLGGALGAVPYIALGMSKMFYLMIFIAGGAGLGMLIAFLIIWKLSQKTPNNKLESAEKTEE